MDPILPISPADRARIAPVPPTPRINAATPDGRRQAPRDADGRRRPQPGHAPEDPYGDEGDEADDAQDAPRPAGPTGAARADGPDHRPHIDISA